MTLNRNSVIRTAGWLALGAVLVCSAGLVLLRDRAVLISFGSDVRSDHGLQLLNPFRSRRIERPAARFLEQLKAGECATVLGRLDPDRDRVTSICSKERDYPMTGWTLDAIGTDRGRALLRYRVGRT